MGRRLLTWLLAVLPSASAMGADLSLGAPVAATLEKDEAGEHRLSIPAGQYARLAVRQEGGNVALSVRGPDGTVLAEVASSEATEWPDPVSIVAGAGGEYRLEVRSLGSDGGPLRYEAILEELHVATPPDERRVAAERAFAEGERLTRGWEGVPRESKRRALVEYRQALDLWNESDVWQRAKTLHRLGQTHASLEESRPALERYAQALALRQALGDRKGEAATAHLMGRSHFRLEDYEKALESYRHALDLRRALGDRRAEAMTLMRLADVYGARGDTAESLPHYERAVALSREVGNRSGETLALRGLAVAEQELGNADRALEIFQQLREWSRASGDRAGEASLLTQMANVYLDLGDAARAIEVLQEALPLRRALEDRRGESATLHDMARAYLQRKEFDKALDFATQELAIEQEVGDRSGPASALAVMGRACLRLKRETEALQHLEQALTVFHTIGNRHWEAVVLEGLGEVHVALGDDGRALQLYEEALALLGKAYPWWESTVLEEMAGIARRRGDLALAQRHLEASIGVVESLRARVAGRERRSTFSASRQDTYEALIDLLMERHRQDPSGAFAAQALGVSERARARMLLEVLVEARVDVREGVDAGLLSRERALAQHIGGKESLRGELLSGALPGDTQARLAEAEHELATLLAEYEDLEAEIRRRSPAYAALAAPRSPSLEELQKKVLDEDSLLLEYALGDTRSFVFSVTRLGVGVRELPSRGAIEALARSAQEQLVKGASRKGRVPLRTALTVLGRTVLGPVAQEIQRARRLVIVPDGALQYVPFAALPGAAGKPLVVSHEIVTLPSASALVALRQELAGREPASRTLAVLADPVFRTEDPRVALAATAGQGVAAAQDVERSVAEAGIGRLERLSFSRREAEAILALVPVESRLGALDFDASRATASSPELANYRIVHFATHGLLNSRHPELSGIVLSLVEKDGRPKEGFLRLHDLYKLRLKADLVVLSACRTALGKDVRGEGLVGLTRGFMYAGAPRVVASLWNVRDAATAELMARFYRGMLRQGLAPAAALRQAQVSMWKEPRFRAPYYWAGFVLQGEWR